ncbi:hypothetical protein DFQ30_002790 [Apophysomyces sp. BC1015]|nr:hypothetical protein DFQ30_002790 [Apophysomyces sp. BC1015]
MAVPRLPRFGAMKLGILSACPKIVSWAEELGLVCVHIEETKNYGSQIEQILPRVDCLFVDVSGSTEEETWTWIDSVVQPYIDTQNILKCVVSPAERVSSKTEWWNELVPRQSCVMKDGKQVDIKKSSMVCAYFCHGSTRRDDVKQYGVQEIQADGCNGTILAWHFLGEIGHKLGYVPKYGA